MVNVECRMCNVEGQARRLDCHMHGHNLPPADVLLELLKLLIIPELNHKRAAAAGVVGNFNFLEEQWVASWTLRPLLRKRERRQGCSYDLREEVQTNSTRPAFPIGERACTASSVQGPCGPGSRFRGEAVNLTPMASGQIVACDFTPSWFCWEYGPHIATGPPLPGPRCSWSKLAGCRVVRHWAVSTGRQRSSGDSWGNLEIAMSLFAFTAAVPTRQRCSNSSHSKRSAPHQFQRLGFASASISFFGEPDGDIRSAAIRWPLRK